MTKSTKVKVKFLDDAFTDPLRSKPEFTKGQEVELEEASANRWIIRNLAVNIKDFQEEPQEELAPHLAKEGDEEVLETLDILKNIEKGNDTPENYEDMNPAQKEEFDRQAAATSDFAVKSTLSDNSVGAGDADLESDSELEQSSKSSKTTSNKHRNKNHK